MERGRTTSPPNLGSSKRAASHRRYDATFAQCKNGTANILQITDYWDCKGIANHKWDCKGMEYHKWDSNRGCTSHMGLQTGCKSQKRDCKYTENHEGIAKKGLQATKRIVKYTGVV